MSEAPAKPEPKVDGAWDVLVSAGAAVTEDTWYDAKRRIHVPRTCIRVGRYRQCFLPSEELSVKHAMEVAAWLLIQELVRGLT